MDTVAAPSTAHRAGSFRELTSVAVPLVISYTTSALMYIADRIFLSWDSVESLAAALPAGVLHYNMAALGIGTVAYANAFVGQYEGADQHQRVGPVLWQGAYLSLIVSAVIMICIPFTPVIFAWFGHDQKVLDLEVSYFRILCWGTFPLLLGTTLACFYSGRGKTLVIMVVDIIAALVDFVLDYLLIFGKFGFPRMGIDGAALSTVIAFTIIPLLYLAIMWYQERGGMYHLWTGRRFDRALFGRLLKFGLPQGVQQFLDIACFTIFIQLVGGLGTEQLSATSLVFNLNSLVFVPMMGLGTAVTALVGRRIGEGRPRLAIRTTWLAAGLGVAYVALFSSLYVLAPQAILKPYGLADKEALRELVVFLLRLVAIYSFFDALAIIFASAIRGAGDTRFALIFSVSLGVVLLVIPTYIASFYGQAGFYYSWYAVTIFIVTLGVGFIARFQQGKWMSMRVIEHTRAELEGHPVIPAEHDDIAEPDDDVLETATR
jgi:MATE family multidrug resistance protein